MYRGLLVSLLLAGACARGEITLPAQDAATLVSLDASTTWAYVELSSGTGVAPANAAASTAWDIGFNGTSVLLNGGTSGPGGIVAYCVCQNATASDQQLASFTPDNQLASFQSVTVADVPPATANWSAEVFATSPWFRFNIGGDNRVHPTFSVYLIKRGSVVYKLQVTSYYGPAGEPRRIGIRYVRVT